MAAASYKQGTPEWWREVLLVELDKQRKRVELLENYALGEHPLPEPPRAMQADVFAEAKRAFASLCRMGVTNWVALVASAPAERLHVRGFRFGDDLDAAAQAQQLWADNGLEAESQLLHDTVFQTGQAYSIVWPGEVVGTATVTFEHPSQVIVAYDSSRNPTAALKRWKADDGRIMVTLYLPDFLYKWRTRSRRPEFGIANGDLTWQERVVPLEPGGEENEPWPLPNPLNEVNVTEFPVNIGLRARPFGGGRSEFDAVLPIQDRINKTIFDRLVTGESQAFRQRYTIGWDPPLGPDGKPDRRAILEASQSKLWMFPGGANGEQVQVGELGQANFSPFIDAVESDVNAMAAISKTPPHYLLGAMENIAADGIVAAESGLVSKATAHSKVLAVPHGRTMRLAMKAAGHQNTSTPTTVWEDIERRSWAEKIDGLTKLQALGVPAEALWALVPDVTPQQVEEWRRLKAAEPPEPAVDEGADTVDA